MRNIELKKESGKIEIVTSIYILVLMMVMVAVYMQIMQFKETRTYMEDALAASNLASAVIDIEEYGTSNQIIITDTDYSYELYKEALVSNLNLDSAWECPNKSLIAGPVTILNYTIYNVRKTDIEVFTYDSDGNRSIKIVRNGLGNVTAPNGTVIMSTSVYSSIGFPVEGIWGVHVDAVKDNLVDIVKN